MMKLGMLFCHGKIRYEFIKLNEMLLLEVPKHIVIN